MNQVEVASVRQPRQGVVVSESEETSLAVAASADVADDHDASPFSAPGWVERRDPDFELRTRAERELALSAFGIVEDLAKAGVRGEPDAAQPVCWQLQEHPGRSVRSDEVVLLIQDDNAVAHDVASGSARQREEIRPRPLHARAFSTIGPGGA